MSKESQEIRTMANVFRETADAADKLADIVENSNSTEQEWEEAEKNFLWQMIKLQALNM